MFIYESLTVQINFETCSMNIVEIKCTYWDSGKCLCVYSALFLVSATFSIFNQDMIADIQVGPVGSVSP